MGCERRRKLTRRLFSRLCCYYATLIKTIIFIKLIYMIFDKYLLCKV